MATCAGRREVRAKKPCRATLGCGNDANEDAVGFDFGPFDRATDDFTHRYTVIVRETAGGGFMLLIQDGATAFADKTRALFKAVAADPERKNPELPDDGDE